MNRREFIAGSSLVIVSSVAGCGGVTGPDPRVVDAETEAGLASLVGIVEFRITVVNEGAAGDVNVILDILDNADTVLEKFGETVFMDEDERRRVSMEVQLPDGAEQYRALAEPA